jgi:hypothetical protein
MTYSRVPPGHDQSQLGEGRWGRFDHDMLTKLALLPEWTPQLAVQAGLASAGQIASLVDLLDDAGLVDRRTTLTAGVRPGEVFWLRPQQRPHLAPYLRERADVAAHIETLVGVLTGYKPLKESEILRQWLEIATRHRADATGQKLIKAVDELLADGKLAKATKLVMTAQAVGEMIGGDLLDAVRRAHWQLDRAHRLAQDERFLGTYVNRHEIEQSIADLLRSDNEQWALHLLGDGGVGKTMVIRYLASGRFATDRGIPKLAIARADFDELDPRYPEERPAELLLSLVGELLGYGLTRRASARFQLFNDTAKLLHEELSHTHPERNRVDELRRRVAVQFAQFLNHLDSGVLLIIDTCEELAKLYPPGASAPAIEETFRLLEEVHRAAPQVRILLAGRRWLTPSDDPRERAAGPELAPRDFMTVRHVQGYGREEADRYLDLTKPSPQLRAAIIDLSGNEQSGYNPFELAMYAEWARADPEVTPETLRTESGNPYIERRVLGRLSSAVVEALPIAISLSRFDLRLIGPSLRRLKLDSAEIFDSLAAQEWVNVLSLGRSGQPHVIEIDEHLRGRLADALPVRQVELAKLGNDAVQAIADVPLAEVPIETVEAAVRCLPAASAASWWENLEERITLDGAWSWASQVTIRAAAVADEQPEPNIVAAILATHASARLHVGNTADLSKTWEAVISKLRHHPDERLRHALRLRAMLGLIACGDDNGSRFKDDLSEAPDDAVVAAADRLLAAGKQLPPPIAMALSEIRSDGESALAVAAKYLYSGHLLDRTGDPWDATGSVGLALDLALEAAEMSHQRLSEYTGKGYRDWIPPARLDLRCRQAVLALAACSNDPRIDMWIREAWSEGCAALSDVDGDRLAALALDCEMRQGVPGADRLVDPGYRPKQPGSLPGWTHRFARPLVVSVAEVCWLRGDPDDAADRLHQQIQAATNAANDPDTIDACQLALLRLCRYYRTTDYLPAVQELSLNGELSVRAEAWLLLTLMWGERPATPHDAGSLYAWFRCQDGRLIRYLRPSIVEEANTPRLNMAVTAHLLGGVVDEPRLDPALAIRPEALAEAIRYWVADGQDVHARLASRGRRRGDYPTQGVVGRAALEAGEVIAVQSAYDAIPVLDYAATTLADVDKSGAARAEALAAIARRRVNEHRAVSEEALQRLEDLSLGWLRRVEALRGKPARDRFYSPELLWARAEKNARHTLLRSFRERLAVVSSWWRAPFVIHPVAWITLLPTWMLIIVFVSVLEPGDYLLGPVVAALYFFVIVISSHLTDPYRMAVAVQITGRGERQAELRLRKHFGLIEVHNGMIRFAPKAWPSDPDEIAILKDAGPIPLTGMQRILTANGRRQALVQLEIAREVESRPWERRLAGTLRPGRSVSTLFFRREPGRYPTTSLSRWLRATTSWPFSAVKPWLQMDSHISLDTPAPLAAIVTGIPVETYAGYRMRVTAAQGLGKDAPSLLDSAEPPLIDPGLHIVYRTGLVVLMAEPSDESPQPLGDLRTGFLGVARAALGANVGAVLIVPPLTDESTAQVKQLVHTHLLRRPFGFLRRPRPQQVLKLLAAVKGLVGEETAIDVLLMMRTDGPYAIGAASGGQSV